MLRIVFGKGRWQKSVNIMELRWEVCPNESCKSHNVNLHYPGYMVSPRCPDCKTVLPGAESMVATGSGKRIAYHLE